MDTLHFRQGEFACSCCEETGVVPHLLAVLELVRIKFNKPVFINSGYRCPQHNLEVGGVTNSQHVQYTAADIEVADISPAEVHAFLNVVFPNSYGLGLYDTFVHVDVREGSRARW